MKLSLFIAAFLVVVAAYVIAWRMLDQWAAREDDPHPPRARRPVRRQRTDDVLPFAKKGTR